MAASAAASASAAVASAAAATLVHWTCFVYTRDATLIVYLLLVSLVIYLCLSSFTSVHFTFLRSSLNLTATSTAIVTAMRLRCELDATSANQRLCSTLARGSVIYRIECRDDWAGPARTLMPVCLCVCECKCKSERTCA